VCVCVCVCVDCRQDSAFACLVCVAMFDATARLRHRANDEQRRSGKSRHKAHTLFSLKKRARLTARAPLTMTADAAPPPAPGIADEIMRRHAGKPGAESRALVGVLSAVLDAVRSRGLDPSPSALFAALMAALDGPRALDEPQVRGRA